MSTTNTMKAGTWCKPSGEKEWKAILDLVEVLGVGDLSEEREYAPYDHIGVKVGDEVDAIHPDCLASIPWSDSSPMSVPEFIAGMYAEAERRRDEHQQATILQPLMDLAKKVKELGLDNPNQLVGVKQLMMDDHEARIKAVGERLLGVEKALNEHLRQEMAGRTGTGVSAPPQVGATNGDYAIFFDPKASPTGIPFEVALAYLKAGRKIQRRGWNSGAWYFMDREHVMFHPHGFEVSVYPAQTTASEVLANDWMVIPQP